MKRVGVVLLSGGLDSTTVAAYAKRQLNELTAVTFYYGQKHFREVEAAKKVATSLGIEQQVIDISFFKSIAWYSALTSSDDFRVPKAKEIDNITSDIPITYVPMRNTLFITIGAALLESKALSLIEDEQVDPKELEASIFIAANAIDYSGYPDCRPKYYKKMTEALFKGSKLGVKYNNRMKIHTPILFKSKAEIIKLAMKLKVPLEHTWSCYEGEELPCGNCDSCILRAKGFAEAGFEDPLLVSL